MLFSFQKNQVFLLIRCQKGKLPMHCNRFLLLISSAVMIIAVFFCGLKTATAQDVITETGMVLEGQLTFEDLQ